MLWVNGNFVERVDQIIESSLIFVQKRKQRIVRSTDHRIVLFCKLILNASTFAIDVWEDLFVLYRTSTILYYPILPALTPLSRRNWKTGSRMVICRRHRTMKLISVTILLCLKKYGPAVHREQSPVLIQRQAFYPLGWLYRVAFIDCMSISKVVRIRLSVRSFGEKCNRICIVAHLLLQLRTIFPSLNYSKETVIRCYRNRTRRRRGCGGCYQWHRWGGNKELEICGWIRQTHTFYPSVEMELWKASVINKQHKARVDKTTLPVV